MLRILRHWAGRCLAVVLGLVALLGCATCTMAPGLSPGVRQTTAVVDCGGERVKVDFYAPASREPCPVVVVAHGFTRSKRYMAGWGAELAARGMAAAVLTQPKVSGHARNAVAIRQLLEAGVKGEWPGGVLCNGRTGLAGFSMGGLTTLLAASQRPELDAWLGLDPVDFDGLGAQAAAKVKARGLALLAEPAAFNRDGNAVAMLRPYAGSLSVVRVIGASHLDAEYPTDALGQWMCGWVNPRRQQWFRSLGLDFLEAVLKGQPPPAMPETEEVRPVMIPGRP